MQEKLYQFPKRFYLLQIVYLCLSGVFCLWFSRQYALDHAITNYWFDPIGRQFPLKNSYWLELLNHKALKYLVIGVASWFLFFGIKRRRFDFIVLVVLIGSGSAVVGLLKSISQHSCPWDLIEYGGKALEYPLLSTASYFDSPGHCFPGGHASGGFSLMALFFVWYPRNRKLAIMIFCSAMLLGQIMGFGQVVRGAHFLSHNLWSCWWVWTVQVFIYGMLSSFMPYGINWRSELPSS